MATCSDMRLEEGHGSEAKAGAFAAIEALAETLKMVLFFPEREHACRFLQGRIGSVPGS